MSEESTSIAVVYPVTVDGLRDFGDDISHSVQEAE